MRSLLFGVAAAAMLLCAFSAPGATTVHKKKSSSKAVAARKGGVRKSAGTASKTAAKSGAKPSTSRTTASSARRNGKRPVATRTWRNRQMAPTPERYHEIQQAMVTKGFLKPEDVSSGWDQNSIDALKRFQAAQNLEVTGKINSLSLIALGLGPKHDTASITTSTESVQSDR